MAFRVMPVILTYEMDLSLTRTFVTGFRNVLIDQSHSPVLSGQYLSIIASAGPCGVYVHGRSPGVSCYDSVQDGANFALRLALEHSADEDYILFLEDDVAFSSRFAEKVTNTYLGPETGFLTLYTPRREYGSSIVEPTRFYGTLSTFHP
jgi:hypothetical protein